MSKIIGKEVKVIIDRPLGSHHLKYHNTIYVGLLLKRGKIIQKNRLKSIFNFKNNILIMILKSKIKISML